MRGEAAHRRGAEEKEVHVERHGLYTRGAGATRDEDDTSTRTDGTVTDKFGVLVNVPTQHITKAPNSTHADGTHRRCYALALYMCPGCCALGAVRMSALIRACDVRRA